MAGDELANILKDRSPYAHENLHRKVNKIADERKVQCHGASLFVNVIHDVLFIASKHSWTKAKISAPFIIQLMTSEFDLTTGIFTFCDH